MKLKERLRGIVAAVATAALALSVAPVTAMADTIGGNSVTINNVESGDSVTLYQVVKTVVNEQNVATNAFVTEGFGLNFETGWTEANKESAANTIAAYVNQHGDQWGDDGFTKYGPETATSSSITFEGVDAGQYLVVVTSDSDSTRVYQNTIVTVEPSTEGGVFGPNDEVPNTENSATLKFTDLDEDENGSAVDKLINGKDAVDDVDKGDEVTFTITTTVPRYTVNGRTFKLTDTMSEGFVDPTTPTVWFGGAEATEDNTLVAGTDYILGSASGFFDTITLTDTGLFRAAGQTLHVSYKATLGDSAVYSDSETNTVLLTFSKNSFEEAPTGSAEDTVYLTVYGITFTKQNADNEPLQNAVFQIQDASGAVIYDGLTTGLDGVITLDGALAAGQTYTLVETSAPAGYKPIQNMTFMIASGADSDEDGVKEGYLYSLNGGVIVDEENDIFSSLPETGGTGTVALTVVGVGLMAGAAFLVMRSRKEN